MKKIILLMILSLSLISCGSTNLTGNTNISSKSDNFTGTTTYRHKSLSGMNLFSHSAFEIMKIVKKDGTSYFKAKTLYRTGSPFYISSCFIFTDSDNKVEINLPNGDVKYSSTYECTNTGIIKDNNIEKLKELLQQNTTYLVFESDSKRSESILLTNNEKKCLLEILDFQEPNIIE